MKLHGFILLNLACFSTGCLQCFDTVGWPSARAKWWGAGVVICLQRGANDLHRPMVQLMPLPPQIGLTFLVLALSWNRGH